MTLSAAGLRELTAETPRPQRRPLDGLSVHGRSWRLFTSNLEGELRDFAWQRAPRRCYLAALGGASGSA